MRGQRQTGRLVGAGIVAAAALLGASNAGATSPVATPPSATGTARSVTPIVECSVADHGVTRTLFGYHNTGPAVTVSVGPDNAFSPGPASRGQPTRFATGTQINVFQVRDAAGVVWKLGGQEARAPGPACQASPAGSALAGWGPIAALVGVAGVLGVLLFWRTRRLRVRVA